MAKIYTILVPLVFVIVPSIQAVGECPHPGTIDNGFYRFDRRIGGELTVECGGGYKYTGTPLRLCRVNGTWTGKAGMCNAVPCPQLPDPPHGNMQYTGHGYNDTAIVICDGGFTYSHPQSNTQTCGNGTWSTSFGICESIQCPYPSSPEHCHLYLLNRYINGTASFSCDEGYIYNGTTPRFCEENGQWNGTGGVCQDVRCSGLTEPPHGAISYSGHAFRDTLTVQCDTGYAANSDTGTCQADNTWSSDNAVCELITCPIPTIPERACLEMPHHYVNDTAIFFCPDGYEYTGTPTWLCQSDGQWRGTSGFCEANLCPKLDAPANCTLNITHRTVNGTATYKGKTGFNYNGTTARICQPNGHWNGIQGTCQEIHCRTPVMIKNGKTSASTEDRYETIISLQCDPGFEMRGNNEMKCQSDGHWSTPGECKKRQQDNMISTGVLIGVGVAIILVTALVYLGVSVAVQKLGTRYKREATRTTHYKQVEGTTDGSQLELKTIK